MGNTGLFSTDLIWIICIIVSAVVAAGSAIGIVLILVNSKKKTSKVSQQPSVKQPQAQNLQQQKPQVQQPQVQQPPVQQPQAEKVNNNIGETVVQKQSFGETEVLGDGSGETTVLNNAIPVCACIIREKTGTQVTISKPDFRIGKEAARVDYCVDDNSAVSRVHAIISFSGNNFYIIDNNTTNHTYVNESLIPSNSEFPIYNGDSIKLANERFVIKIG